MLQTCETRHDGRASRNSCGGWFREDTKLVDLRSQHISARLGVPLNRANLIAGLCFGEVRHAG